MSCTVLKWESMRFHHRTQNDRQFKTWIVYFWDFPCNIFRLWLTDGNRNLEDGDKERRLCILIHLFLKCILSNGFDQRFFPQPCSVYQWAHQRHSFFISVRAFWFLSSLSYSFLECSFLYSITHLSSHTVHFFHERP